MHCQIRTSCSALKKFFPSNVYEMKSLQAAKEPFHFISLLVQLLVVFPWLPTITFRRDHGNAAKIAHQLARFVTLIGAIHDDVRSPYLRALQQRTPFWRIAGIAR
jgi:hypothetical protein